MTEARWKAGALAALRTGLGEYGSPQPVEKMHRNGDVTIDGARCMVRGSQAIEYSRAAPGVVYFGRTFVLAASTPATTPPTQPPARRDETAT